MRTTCNRREFLQICGFFCSSLPVFGRTPILSRCPTQTPVSLEEKIGQMLMVGFRGLEVSGSHPIVQDIRFRHIGGVVLFDYDIPANSPVRNVESPNQLKSLVSSLQSYTRTPLFIAVDHEGGRITRLKEKFGFPETFSAKFLGERDDLELTLKHADTMAQQLSRLGINLNLAPVVDLNTNPDNPIIGSLERSFSADPDAVIRHASVFILAHHRQKVLCTLKHFPGHGSSSEDSHLGMVDITETWAEGELLPYKKLIQRGQVDAIMTAHVFNKDLDPEYPATLSKRIITGILRERLNYKGVVISDDMQMGAITSGYGLETAIHKAINADVDILAFANNSTFDAEIATKAVKIIRKLLAKKVISLSRIDESYSRIQRLKSRWIASS